MSLIPHVYVVDDDPLVCLQVASLLESHGTAVRCYSDGLSFLNSEKLEAGVVLLDNYMPQLSGMEVLEDISKRDVYLPCVMMSGAADIALTVRAMKLGAKDFLEKPFGAEDLIGALISAWNVVDFQVIRNRALATTKLVELSARERDVLQRLMGGYSNRTIAEALRISVRTVEMHRANMKKRLGVRTLAEAMQFAISATGPADGFRSASPEGWR